MSIISSHLDIVVSWNEGHSVDLSWQASPYHASFVERIMPFDGLPQSPSTVSPCPLTSLGGGALHHLSRLLYLCDVESQ